VISVKNNRRRAHREITEKKNKKDTVNLCEYTL
jgi:hypothetical protein